ncbi:MAG: hypothetical protein LUH02_06095 [Erysipelotrichaceae bacterium]|nr:hypothetical protein [Erysipelotrichaceae bacterium]
MDGFKIIVALLVVIVVSIIITQLLKRKAINDVYTNMENKHFDKCFEIMNKRWCKISFSGYEYLMLRLDVAMAVNSNKYVDECMDKLSTTYMNKKHQEQILYMGMTYYVEKENKKRCEWILKQLEKIKSNTVYLESLKLYHVFILKDGYYINDMEKEFADTDDIQTKKALASFLVIQYENVGNIEKMDKYKEILKGYQKEVT